MAKMCLSLVSAILVALYMGADSVEASNKYKMPDSCKGQSYCFEKGEHYPEKEVEKLLEAMPKVLVENSTPQIQIGSRKGDSPNEPDCLSESNENPIYYIIDKNDNVRVVVQSPEKFPQIYSVEWCLNEGRIRNETAHFLMSTVNKYNIQCVSTRMDLAFIVLNDTEAKMEIAMAKGGIPVCCRCIYDANDYDY